MNMILTTVTTLVFTLGGVGLAQAQEHGHGHGQGHRSQGHHAGHQSMMEDGGMTGPMSGRMHMMMNAELSQHDPAALLAMRESLELSQEQVEQLQALAERTQREATALLSEAQRRQLEQVPERPRSMMQMHRQMMQRMEGMQGDNGKGMCPMCAMMKEQDGAGATQPAERVELNAEMQATLDQIVTSYLTVQQRLANDQMEGVNAQLMELHDAAHALFKADSAKVQAQARAVAETVHSQPKNLNEARAVFKALSAEVIKLTDLALPGDQAVPALYQAHCPMAEASWLQADSEIINPYMGQGMLRCGTIEDTIKPGNED